MTPPQLKKSAPVSSRRKVAIGAALAAGVLVLFTTTIGSSLTSVIDIHPAIAHDHPDPITADGLKPAACNGITLATLVNPGGTVPSPPAGHPTWGSLILADGASTADLTGGTGDNCIIGGALTHELYGGPGNDVCIRSNPATIFDASCETQLP